MNIKNLFLCFLILIISNCQKTKTVNFEDSYKISSNINYNSNLLIINIDLKNGFHAYAAGEKIGRPVKLEIKSDNGWSAVGHALIPKGRVKKLASSSQSHVLENKFNIEQGIKIGTGVGQALLYLQICTDSACDRPRIHEIALSPK